MREALPLAALLAASALFLWLMMVSPEAPAAGAPGPAGLAGPAGPAGRGAVAVARPPSRMAASIDPGAAEERREEASAVHGDPVERSSVAAEAVEGAGCTVEGRVTDASGAELALPEGCHIRFEDEGGGARTVDAGEDGAYSVSGLWPGRWLVACAPPGYRQAQEVLEIPPGARSVRHDIALRRAACVRVSVLTPDGRALNEAAREVNGASLLAMNLVPVATVAPPGPVLADVWGSKGNPYGAGRLAMRDLLPEPLPPGYVGTLLLDGDPPVYASLFLRSSLLDTQRVEPGATDAVFTLSVEQLLAAGSGLRLRVVEADTLEPIEGAAISLVGGVLTVNWPRTDAQGSVALEPWAPGEYELWLLAEGREHVRRRVALPPGETLDLGTVALVPALHVSGRVVDAEGQPVATTLELGRIDPATRRLELFRTQWMSDALGAFAIDHLGNAEYVLRASGEPAWTDSELQPRNPFLGDPPPTSISANLPVSTLRGSVDGVELVLVPRGRLVLRAGERSDRAELRYEALDGQGLPRAAGRMLGALQLAVELPRGDYRLLVTGAAGAKVLEQPITVGETPVAIDLPRE